MLSEAFGSAHNLSVWKQTEDVALRLDLTPGASARVHECIKFVFNFKNTQKIHVYNWNNEQILEGL